MNPVVEANRRFFGGASTETKDIVLLFEDGHRTTNRSVRLTPNPTRVIGPAPERRNRGLLRSEPQVCSMPTFGVGELKTFGDKRSAISSHKLGALAYTQAVLVKDILLSTGQPYR